MKLIKRNETVPVSFVLEEYIPLSITYPGIAEYHPTFEFVKGGKSMLEVSVGRESRRISEITLVNCEDYAIKENAMPIFNSEIGDIEFDVEMPDTVEHINVESFRIQVFNNGAVLCLSNEPATMFVRNNQVTWAVDQNGNVAQLLLSMESDAIEHLKHELLLQ